MSASTYRYVRHLPRQLPLAWTLGRTALAGVLGSRAAGAESEVAQTIAPIAPALIRDYVTHVGGDPLRYRTTVPPHLFPQWAMGPIARTLAGVAYPMHRVLNAGCRLEVHADLPVGVPLVTRASIAAIDDDGRRAVLALRSSTGTSEDPDAVVATLHAVVPLARGRRGATASRPVIPYDATELARWRLAKDAGLAFALLTGDFNPIHWARRAGVAAGFGGTILHGFAIFARAIEGVVRGRFAGDASQVRVWDARFTRPLRLPADVTLFARDREAWVGEARGGAPFMTLAFGGTDD